MVLALAGCGDDDGGGSATNVGGNNPTTSSSAAGSATTAAAAGGCNIEGGVTTPPEQQVMLTLDEWTIKPSLEPKAGTIAFVAENAGEEPHEVAIVKGDSAEALPTTAQGAMDEEKLPEGALIGEIEPFASGELCKGVFTLAAGNYVLLCNIVETEPSGEVESHFKEGMHTPFTVS